MWHWRYAVEGSATLFLKNRRFVWDREDVEPVDRRRNGQERGIGEDIVDGLVPVCKDREAVYEDASRLLALGAYTRYNGGTGPNGNYWDFNVEEECWYRATNYIGENPRDRADDFWEVYQSLPSSTQ